MEPSPDRLILVEAVGGLGEMGHHHLIVDLGPDSFLLDFGALFPDPRDPGIEWVAPSPEPAAEREASGRLRGLLLTHGHRDHIGAVTELLRRLPHLPIYGTSFTLALLESQLERDDYRGPTPSLRVVDQGRPVAIGEAEVTWFAVTHSIPSASSVAIESPWGRVIHSGDFRIQDEPLLGPPSDEAGLRALGERGVDLALVDSTGAGSPGETLSEAEVVDNLAEQIGEADGRVIVTTFSSHLERMAGLLEVAERTGRRLAVYGRSMDRMVELGAAQGLFSEMKRGLQPVQSVMAGPRNQALIAVTGSQGEARAPLSRMARREDRYRLEEGDVVCWSSRVIPGNEKAVGAVVNNFLEQGVSVIPPWGAGHGIHTSGHARRDEIARWLSWVQPRHVLPIHGERWHLAQHRELLASVGYSADQVFEVNSGECLRLEPDTGRAQLSPGSAGPSLVLTGTQVWPQGEAAIRTRRKLARFGSASLVVLWDERRSRPSGPVCVATQGVFAEAECAAQEGAVAREVEMVLRDAPDRPRDQWIEAGRLALRRSIRARSGTKVPCNCRLLPTELVVENEMV
ncbi:MAG: ribonuclease J [Myxococcota bacterium]|nr:ribonuclease J [Myxococcota bacterium]